MAETKDISDEEKKKQEEDKKKEEDKKEMSNGTDTETVDETADAPTIDERVIAMEDKVNALAEQVATIIDTINEKADAGDLGEQLADKTEEEKKKEDEKKKEEEKKEMSDKTETDKVELSKRIDSMEKMLVKLSKTGTSKLNPSGSNADPDDAIIDSVGKRFF